MSQTNFLIGRGELLTHDIVGPKRMPGKAEIYTFAQARERLAPQFRSVARALDELPADACPGDFAVARLMGPDLEVEDQEVHAWTSVIDEGRARAGSGSACHTVEKVRRCMSALLAISMMAFIRADPWTPPF